MNIVLVSSEVDPLAKTGGLADVASSLAVALHRAKDSVSIVMPFYRSIDTQKYNVRDTGVRVQVPLDGTLHEGTIWQHRYRGVPIYLLGNPAFYDREGLYGADGSDYPDNALRFAFLSRGALEVAKALDLHPDAFHVNDWQSALLPVYRKLLYHDDAILGRAGVVLTLHNLAYQGNFDRDFVPRMGLPWDAFTMDGLEFYGNMSFLKGGVVFSDILSTVSPTYAGEIQTSKAGAGLEGLLSKRSHELYGILNGIDTSVWNPGKDTAIFASYSRGKPDGKAVNKKRLQKKLGLRVSSRTPLFAAIARLDPQKGFDLLLEATPSMLADGAQLVLLGTGERRYLDGFAKLQAAFPDRLSLNEGFQPELGRQIYAGADLFLMPSRYEPCGLGQMIALRYGTVPVVRRTGGLADTIIDLDREPERGNGFVFDDYRPSALLDATRRAMVRFRDEKSWRALVRRAMAADFSWKKASGRYQELYALAAEKARRGKPE